MNIKGLIAILSATLVMGCNAIWVSANDMRATGTIITQDDLSTKVKLDITGSPYRITEDIVIGVDADIHIEEDVEVIVDAGKTITVYGELDVYNSYKQFKGGLVHFTCDNGLWGGFIIDGSKLDDPYDGGIWGGVEISNADVGVTLVNDAYGIDEAIIHDCNTGVVANTLYGSVRNCRLYDNIVGVELNTVEGVLTSSIIENNETGVIINDKDPLIYDNIIRNNKSCGLLLKEQVIALEDGFGLHGLALDNKINLRVESEKPLDGFGINVNSYMYGMKEEDIAKTIDADGASIYTDFVKEEKEYDYHYVTYDLYNDRGLYTDNISEAKNIGIDISNYGMPYDCKVVVAMYDLDGRLLDVQMVEQYVPGYYVNTLELAEGTEEVKILVWDSFDKLMPIPVVLL